jgi:hypothetical protein
MILRIQNIISSTSFEKLAKNGKKNEGFFEIAFRKSNQDKVKFFNKGKKNDWRKYLNENEIRILLKINLNYEMKELGYI